MKAAVPVSEKLRYIYALDSTIPKVVESTSIPTQTMEQYYVQPHLVKVDKETYERTSIELRSVFDQGKHVLLEGGFGTGKTVLLQKASTENYGFEYVFRIKLKLLLTNWKRDYSSDDIDENPLACFIHYSIKKLYAKISGSKTLDMNYKIKLTEIKEVVTKEFYENTILLLDGDNDLAALLRDDEAKDLIYQLLEYPRIIMTSRSNTLPTIFLNEFDLRIEVEGFTVNEARSYISKFFLNQIMLLTKEIEDFFHLEQHSHSTKSDLLNYLSHQKRDHIEKYEMSVQLKKIDQRHNLGESREDIIASIAQYYARSETMLFTLLEESSVKELSQSPMVTSMLCLVFSDPLSRAELAMADLTISKLYQEFVVWLGRKYFYELGANIEDLTKERILESNLFLTLKEIAYTSIRNNNLVDGETIDRIARKHSTDISSIYQLGILKVAVRNSNADENDLVHHTYSFIRLSVQDYLAAVLLQDLLGSKNIEEAREAANFIALIRNEAKYLTILKFMAEMIAHDPGAGIGLIRFWEAVTCNINGVLELGADMKVSLLMHLAESAKIENTLDPRIPNLEAIQEFIDTMVVEDILGWADVIRSSSYLSEKMSLAIWQKLYSLDDDSAALSVSYDSAEASSSPAKRKKYSFKDLQSFSATKTLDIKSLTNILMSLINKLDKQRLLENLETKLVSDDQQIKEMAIKLISHLSLRSVSTFSIEKTKSILSKLVTCLSLDALSDISIDAIVNILQTNDYNPELISQILDSTLPVLFHKEMNVYLIKLVNAILQNEPTNAILKITEIITETYLKTLNPSTFEDSSLSASLTLDILHLLGAPSNYHPTIVLSNIADIIIGIFKEEHSENILDLLEYFITELKTPLHVEAASFIITRLAVKNDFILNYLFNKFITLLSEDASSTAASSILVSEGISSITGVVLEVINTILTQNNRMFDTILVERLLKTLEFLTLDKSHCDQAVSIIGKIILVNDIEPRKNIRLIDDILEKSPANKQIIYRTLVSISANKALNDEVVEKIFIILLEAFVNPENSVTVAISNNLVELTERNNSDALNMQMFLHLKDIYFSVQNGQYLLAIPLSNLLIKPYIYQTITVIDLEKIADTYIENLTLGSRSNRVIDAIGRLQSSEDRVKTIFFDKLIKLIQSGIEGHNFLNAIHALEKLQYTLTNNTILLEKLFENIYSFNSPDVVAKLISSIILGNQELTETTLTRLQDYLHGPNKANIHKNALYIIGKIIETNIIEDSVLASIFELTFPLLDNKKLDSKAIYVLSKIFQQESFISTTPLDHLNKFLGFITSSRDIEIIKHSCIIINSIILRQLSDIGPEAVKAVIKPVASLLSNDEYLPLASSVIFTAITNLPFYDSVLFLKSSNKALRKVTAEFFAKNLQDSFIIDDSSNIETWGRLLTKMLNVLARKEFESEPEIKKLHDLTRKLSLKHIDNSKDPNIAWINEHFDELYSITSFEFETIMLRIYHIALSDYKITSIESKFVIKCIKIFGFTNVIYSPRKNDQGEIEFKILFDGKLYTFIGKENLEHMEYFARALIQSPDLLASQYRENIPLFINTGSAIDIAASDIKECKSLVTGANLTPGGCQLSFLCLSTDLQESPSTAFIISEERILGFYVIHKIYFKQGSFKVSHKSLHPLELAIEELSLRISIFGNLNYQGFSIPSFFGQTWTLNADINSLFYKVDITKSAAITSSAESPKPLTFTTLVRGVSDAPSDTSLGPNDYRALFDFLKEIPELASFIITGDWEKDVLVLVPFAGEILLQQDRRLDIERIHQHRKIEEVRETVIEHEALIREMQDKLKHIDFPTLEAVMTEQRALAQADSDFTKIKSSPYLYAFLKALSLQLNAVYVASSVISSNMVEGTAQDLASKAGKCLDFFSDQPIVGLGVKILGQVLKGYGQHRQNLRIEHYSTIVLDSVEMSKLTREIATKLALSEAIFVAKQKTASELIVGAANAILDLSIAEVVTNICDDFQARAEIAARAQVFEGSSPVLAYAQRFALAYTLAPTDEQRGEHDAKIVAEIIIAHIFLGSYSGMEFSEIVDNVIKDVIAEATAPIINMDSTVSDDSSSQASSNTAALSSANPLLSSKADNPMPLSSSGDQNHQAVKDASSISNALPAEPERVSVCCWPFSLCFRVAVPEPSNLLLRSELLPKVREIISTKHSSKIALSSLIALGDNEEEFSKFVTKVDKYGIENAINQVLARQAFDKMLELAKILYLNPKEAELLEKLGQDDADAQEILAAIEERGLKEVLNDLFTLQTETTSLNPDLLANIDEFEQLTSGESRFRDFIDAIIFKRGSYKQFEQLLDSLVNFYKNLESLLNMEAWYEYLGFDTRDLVTINMMQFEGALEQLGSHNFAFGVPMFRPAPPGFPGGYGGSGGSGGNGDGNTPNHNPSNETASLDFSILLGGRVHYNFNITDHDHSS